MIPMKRSPAALRDLERLADIIIRSLTPIGHKHCSRCGRCLITGGNTHTPCAEKFDYLRVVRLFKSNR